MIHNVLIGDLVRYGDGPTALMRVTELTRVGGEIRIYGRGFHSSGTCTGRYASQCYEPSKEDRARWEEAHDDKDNWINGKW